MCADSSYQSCLLFLHLSSWLPSCPWLPLLPTSFSEQQGTCSADLFQTGSLSSFLRLYSAPPLMTSADFSSSPRTLHLFWLDLVVGTASAHHSWLVKVLNCSSPLNKISASESSDPSSDETAAVLGFDDVFLSVYFMFGFFFFFSLEGFIVSSTLLNLPAASLPSAGSHTTIFTIF